MPHYIADDIYQKLVAALIAGPQGITDTSDHIKLTLGEIADVWPASIEIDHMWELLADLDVDGAANAI